MKFVILCTLVGLSQAGYRIMGGEDVRTGELPYQAYLQMPREDGFVHDCGGSLIHPEWILTAAHCILGYKTNVLLGGVDVDGDFSYDEDAKLRIVHPGFINVPGEGNDIALLKIPRVTFKDLKLIELEPGTFGALDNETALASGYGLIDNMAGAVTMQKVNLRVLPEAECPNLIPMDQTMICVTYATDPGQSPCMGDSGGPLVVRRNGKDYQVGITSFVTNGKTCVGGPTVFTRVAAYKDWIAKNIAEN